MTDDTDLAARLHEMRGAAGMTDWEAYDEDLTDAFLRALATAYDEGRLVVDDGWQPIETAPKDGTRVMAYWPDCYGNNAAAQVESWFGPWSKGNAKMTWQSAFEWDDGHNSPTHWRPLPAPPKGEGKG